jgi:hypothetical protein
MPPELEPQRCGFCGKMNARSVATPGGFICAPCVHRLIATGVPSTTRGLQCAWCGKGEDELPVLYEGLRPLEARGLGLGAPALAGPTGQIAICGACLALAGDIVT